MLSTLLTLLFSCNKFESQPAVEMGFNYFPLKIGATISYNVDSTAYNDFNNSTTNYSFKIKDSTAQRYFAANGDTTYRIERYKKIGNGNWAFQKTIARRIVQNRAEEVLDNMTFVRLIFPINIERTWNGNAYNTLEPWLHEITELDAPFTTGNKILQETLTVNQNYENNLIREDIYQETYAKNIGMVDKQVRAIDKDISTGRIKRGYVYRMQLDSYK